MQLGEGITMKITKAETMIRSEGKRPFAVDIREVRSPDQENLLLEVKDSEVLLFINHEDSLLWLSIHERRDGKRQCVWQGPIANHFVTVAKDTPFDEAMRRFKGE